MLTRKHFQRIAEVVSTIDNIEDRNRVTSMMSGVLAQTNPNFNHCKFVYECTKDERFRDAAEAKSTYERYTKA
jgi:hypothetical protein